MQFIKDGPDVPEELIRAHEEGKVVFFCGAGISYPAGLPGFEVLVNQIFEELGSKKSDVENTAFNKKRFDKTIGLLENRLEDGRFAVRKAISKILTPKLSGKKSTRVHEALLDLARSRESRFKLITTNFDRIFETIISKKKLDIPRNKAPFLPTPKKRWNSVVYLHGLLPEKDNEDELNSLVVSSGDFGLAYLTERWASRFVSLLFQLYNVCFVGYSIDDPILRYMMDALAADQLQGENTPKVYAFGGYEIGEKEKAANEWKAKNVIPILYSDKNNHSLLHETLAEWASVYSSGIFGKEQVVVNEVKGKPPISTSEDSPVRRVLWALSDESGQPAKRFAELEPVPPLDWLEPLSENIFSKHDLNRFGIYFRDHKKFVRKFSLLNRPTSFLRSRNIAPVLGCNNFSELDKVMLHIFKWLSRHVDNPELLVWIANHGGKLHPQFSIFIRKELKKNPPDLFLRKLWELVLNNQLKCDMYDFRLYDWLDDYNKNGLTGSGKMRLIELLSPKIEFRTSFGFDYDKDAKKNNKELIECSVVLNADHAKEIFSKKKKNEKWKHTLVELLPSLNELLENTFCLMKSLELASSKHDLSYYHRPSITKHPQNRGFQQWEILVELIADGWLLANESRQDLAILIFNSWKLQRFPFFHRLQLFAITQTEIISEEEIMNLFSENDYWWLWAIETKREIMQFLRLAYKQLSSQNQKTLQNAILKGPPVDMYRKDLSAEELKKSVDYNIWLRLSKICEGGGNLTKKTKSELQDISSKYPWKISHDESDEFPVWISAGGDFKLVQTPENLQDLVSWLKGTPKREFWTEDDWKERCRNDFLLSSEALLQLLKKGVFPEDRWREALQSWSEEELIKQSWEKMAACFAELSNKNIVKIETSLCWWLKEASKVISKKKLIYYKLTKRILNLFSQETDEVGTISVSGAINHSIGIITEGLISFWNKNGLKEKSKISKYLRPIFSSICNPKNKGLLSGRLVLASNVTTFFRVDHAWTMVNLIPLFNWNRSLIEAKAVWMGFLMSPVMYKPLLDEIKDYFLLTSKHVAELGMCKAQYPRFLINVGIRFNDLFSKEELREVLNEMSLGELEEGSEMLVLLLDSAGNQRENYFDNQVLPLIKQSWPKDKIKISEGISEAFAKICIFSGNAFPDAVKELNLWLKKTKYFGHIMSFIKEHNLCQKFPEKALEFISKVIDETMPWDGTTVKECLEEIRSAKPKLEKKRTFLQLEQYILKNK